MLEPITSVLFDLDNTLTDRSPSIHAFSRRFFDDFRHVLDAQVTLDEVQRVIERGDGGGYRPKDVMFQEIQTDLGWRGCPAQTVIAEYWYRVSAECMQLRPDVQPTLMELRRRGLRLGIITNGKTDVQNATIDATGLQAYFPIIVVSETCGFRKPDQRIFQLALAALDTAPQNAVYVGDYPSSDIEGARKAGLQAVWFAGVHPWPQDLQPPSHQITHFAQLLDWLDQP